MYLVKCVKGHFYEAEPTDSMPLLAPKSIQPEDIELSDDAVFVWEIV
ncbi:MAG: hypothetical protein ACI4RR_04725 [Eubacterium sp.]